jgi:hypothetical protein
VAYGSFQSFYELGHEEARFHSVMKNADISRGERGGHSKGRELRDWAMAKSLAYSYYQSLTHPDIGGILNSRQYIDLWYIYTYVWAMNLVLPRSCEMLHRRVRVAERK